MYQDKRISGFVFIYQCEMYNVKFDLKDAGILQNDGTEVNQLGL